MIDNLLDIRESDGPIPDTPGSEARGLQKAGNGGLGVAAPDGELENAVGCATEALLAEQQEDGHWVYELEADSTIPAEYVLLVHYLGERPDLELERKIGRYLRRIQQSDGGWPLFTDGAPNVSASVKAYFALKVIGDDEEAEHMQRARRAIHAMGGAEMSNPKFQQRLGESALVP